MDDFNVLQFINNNCDTTRARDSKIKNALNGGAPCYVSQVKHGGGDYYKIYYKNNGAIKNMLKKKTPVNEKMIEELKKHGAIIAQ